MYFYHTATTKRLTKRLKNRGVKGMVVRGDDNPNRRYLWIYGEQKHVLGLGRCRREAEEEIDRL